MLQRRVYCGPHERRSFNSMTLQDLGLSDWHASHVEESARDGFEIARVLDVNRNNWKVQSASGVMRAELTGRLSWSSDLASDRPAAGDWVWIQAFDDGDWAMIDGVLPRRTILKRKTAGQSVDIQIIATNVDTAFIVQACDRDFNPSRLDRYLVAVREGGVQPRLILSKCDLVSPEERSLFLAALQTRAPDLTFLFVSSETGEGLDELRKSLTPGQTFCLLGSSGVGKTTLLNTLLDEERFDTQSVRESDKRGRHTTTRRHLTPLPGGALMIDTPGMREFGLVAADGGMEQSFSEIEELAASCRFNDCLHETENGCAVLQAIEDGDLDADRLRSWKKLQREANRHDMSIAEKRRKDKDLGKFYKRTLAGKRDRR